MVPNFCIGRTSRPSLSLAVLACLLAVLACLLAVTSRPSLSPSRPTLSPSRPSLSPSRPSLSPSFRPILSPTLSKPSYLVQATHIYPLSVSCIEFLVQNLLVSTKF
ncbi:S2-RNase [Pyrus ussuriensis x Pyrus communis]|uniref:S2-RNase n=1 Tax=Pyrus ussuriensis x Pyrus communis TaxID=2448454 RepID=A0A5N5HTW1_9ROSA|nr:S2-RNase [Pyrus ussuriensis x Pyrus communis]